MASKTIEGLIKTLLSILEKLVRKRKLYELARLHLQNHFVALLGQQQVLRGPTGI